MPSGATTPVPDGRQKPGQASKNGNKKKAVVTCDIEIEPDELVPVYLETKIKLFEFEKSQQGKRKQNSNTSEASDGVDLQAELRAMIVRIEKDVLFDKFAAEQEWKTKKVVLEKEFAAAKKQQAQEGKEKEPPKAVAEAAGSSDGDINDEAERIAAEILAQNDDDDDGGLGDLFAKLPVTEVDATGKSSTVLNGTDGVKITIRDFGKWTGVSPMRALEEACRARYGLSITDAQYSC